MAQGVVFKFCSIIEERVLFSLFDERFNTKEIRNIVKKLKERNR